jgi:hypothetical protein
MRLWVDPYLGEGVVGERRGHAATAATMGAGDVDRASLAAMRSAIQVRTSAVTKAMRRSPSGTAFGKVPSARRLFIAVRDRLVMRATVFRLTRMQSLSLAGGIGVPSKALGNPPIEPYIAAWLIRKVAFCLYLSLLASTTQGLPDKALADTIPRR